MQAYAVISVSVRITEYGVVTQLRQTQIGVSHCGSGLFQRSPQGEQFRNPSELIVLAPRICVVGSRIAVVPQRSPKTGHLWSLQNRPLTDPTPDIDSDEGQFSLR